MRLRYLILSLLFLLGGYAYYEITHFPDRPAGKGGTVEIRKGATVDEITSSLRKEGLVSSSFKMKLYLYVRKFSSVLKSGEYEFSPNLSPRAIVDKMVAGERLRKTFTIPEGYAAKDIARLLEAKGICRAESFLKKALALDAAKKRGLEGTTLEGYLFPDTYEFTKETSEDQIIELMVKNFKKKFDESKIFRPKDLKMSRYQVLILASIIEKETGKEEERTLVSSVFHNRLRKKIPLATDPTVIYGIANFDGNLRKADLERDGPYNSYLRPGLPPTPISNPGLKSIQAALHPSKSEYLYFVSRNDGTHQFSKTLEEHNRAVRQYQLAKNPASQPNP